MKKLITFNDFIVLMFVILAFILGLFIGMKFEQLLAEDDKIILELKKEQLKLEIQKLKQDGSIK